VYKTGICGPVPLHRLQDPGIADIVSYQLLNDPALNDPEKKSEAEPIFEAIVKHLRLSSGIYRSTYPNRFADLDPIAGSVLRDVYGAGAPIEVHDWAASDCRLSAEWANALWQSFPEARVIASDLFLTLIEASHRRETFIFEPDGTPLQYIRPPFVVPLQKPVPSHYPINRIVLAQARRNLREAREAILGNRKGTPWTVQYISLIHPAARALSASNPRFEVRRHSVFAALPQRCHAIRTMNIFNLGYFDESRLREGAASVMESLIDGGVWILGKTTEDTRPPVNSVSILQKNGAALKLLQRLNGGSEIEDLVLREGLVLK
jgi:hypothetical protein